MNKNTFHTNSVQIISPCFSLKQIRPIIDNQRVSKFKYYVPKMSALAPNDKYHYSRPKMPILQRYSSEIKFRNQNPTDRAKLSQQKVLKNGSFICHKKTSSQTLGLSQDTKKQFNDKQPFHSFQKKCLNQSSSANLSRVNISPDSIKNKKIFRPWKTQKISQLKETSQTSTLQNSGPYPPKYPSFVKSRSFQKLSTKSKGEISLQSFNILRKLGSGKFGKVLLVREKKTGFIMAMKVYEKKKIVQSNYLGQFINQLKIQSFLNHPSIIRLYGFFHDELNFYTLMELGCDGQLYKIIKNKKTLSQGATSYIIRQLLSTIDYLHQNNILHRDIKPQNIVLIHGTVKLCDFGWASYKRKDELRSTYCGTPLYLSPQILKGTSYDQKVDVWAIGIMAYQLKIGCSPFNIKNSKQLYKIVTQPLRFPLNGCSAIFKEFISCILHKNPQQRSKPKDLLALEFVEKYQSDQVFQQLNNNRFKLRC